MDYQIYFPSPDLQAYIKCYWSLEGDYCKDLSRQRILPDGCAELIFHYGDPYFHYLEENKKQLQSRAFVFGQITRFIEIGPSAKTGIFAVRFHPHGLKAFLHIGLNELENKAVALDLTFGKEGKDIEEQIILSKTNNARILIIEKFLLLKLAKFDKTDFITDACTKLILYSNGKVGINELALKFSTNRKLLERKFSLSIGMNPKQLTRIIRFQNCLKMLEQKRFTTLTSLAHHNGYYDQAHFIKDFKEIAGIRPKAFFAENLHLSTFFLSSD